MNKVVSLSLLLLSALMLGGCSMFGFGNDKARDEASAELVDPGAVIDPELERRDIRVPRIDTEDFELGVEFGALNVEDFGGSSFTAVRLAYHVSEDVFVEGSYGRSQVSDTVVPPGGSADFPAGGRRPHALRFQRRLQLSCQVRCSWVRVGPSPASCICRAALATPISSTRIG